MIDYIKQKILEDKIISAIPENDLDYLISEIKLLPPNATVLEVGTFAAGTTRYMALARPDVHVYSVDLNTWRSDDPMLEYTREWYNLEYINDDVMRLIQKCYTEGLPNVTLMTGRSLETDIGEIDLLYLDGDHSFESVIKELRYFWKYVKENGVIMGDDANASDVYDAVRLFSFEKDLEVAFYSKQFKFFKNTKTKHLRTSKWNLPNLAPKRPDHFQSGI